MTGIGNDMNPGTGDLPVDYFGKSPVLQNVPLSHDDKSRRGNIFQPSRKVDREKGIAEADESLEIIPGKRRDLLFPGPQFLQISLKPAGGIIPRDDGPVDETGILQR